MTSGPAPRPRTLVAGVGNIFLGDDGFGVEAARRLTEQGCPADVEVADIGIRGVHLAYRLLDGYDTLVLLDATARGGEPGTLYLIDATEPAGRRPPGGVALDGHRMSPDAVLALLDTLCAGTGRCHRGAPWWSAANPRPSRRASASARRWPTPCPERCAWSAN